MLRRSTPVVAWNMDMIETEADILLRFAKVGVHVRVDARVIPEMMRAGS